MKIDTEHLHFWMQAIRESPDPMRTLDAFWKGQLSSKEWLIKILTPYIDDVVTVDIHGGWVGVLASLMFQSDVGPSYKHIRSIDIDPTCEFIANMMNKQEEINGRFKAITADMCSLTTEADIIVNTSCEHISQEHYEIWLQQLPEESLLVLQSNNYELPEHVRTAKTLEEFKEQSKINALWSGSLTTNMYERWMIIGYKNK